MSDFQIAAGVVILVVALAVILFRWQRAHRGSDEAVKKRESQRLLYGGIALAVVVVGFLILLGGR